MLVAYITQAQTILNYLSKGRSLTAKKARNKLFIERPAARIFELRAAGHNIVSLPAVDRNTGHRVVKYMLQAACQ
jgi:hypothetical protein